MRLLRLTFYVAMVFTTMVVSCEKPAPIPEELPTIEVSYDTIEGSWQLTHLNGAELLDDSMLYIVFENPAEEDAVHRYEMWDNLGSMYLVQTTGTYTITEENGNYTLSGTYDNGVGDWNERYHVVMYTNDRMQWRSDNGECLEFKYTIELPEEFNK